MQKIKLLIFSLIHSIVSGTKQQLAELHKQEQNAWRVVCNEQPHHQLTKRLKYSEAKSLSRIFNGYCYYDPEQPDRA